MLPTRPSARQGRATGLLVCLALLFGLLAACGGEDDANLLGDGTADRAAQVSEEQAILDQRATAIRRGDRQLFLSTVDHTNKAFLAEQGRYFDNLAQLPLARFEYQVLTKQWPKTLRTPKWGSDLRVPQVWQRMQLEGFDREPVQRLVGFAFAQRPKGLRIVADRTATGATWPASLPAPWDLTDIKVRTEYNVLGVFDKANFASAGEVADLVDAGVREVSAAVPFSWDQRVVVYCFADKQVLRSFENVPGGNIEHLGALTFPVVAKPGEGAQAGMRFTLLPSSLRAGEPFLGRITRHELTHIAIGDHDDGVPIWVAEGIAEYVGARPLSIGERRIPTLALDRARRGAIDMPTSDHFNGNDQEWNYALAWMAIDYIADTQGEGKVWDLMNALHQGGKGTPDSDQDPVVQGVLGFDSHELARRAAQRIVDIYG